MSTSQTIAANVASVRARIAAACARVSRSPDEVTLIAVTKTHPMEAVRAVVAAGVRDLGENRVQDLQSKAGELPGAWLGGDVRWHHIGHLQTNKAKDVLATADAFHALDSPRLADALQQRAERDERPALRCFVQVNVSGEASKFGIDPDAVHPFIASLSDHDRLQIAGLMTLAAPAPDPEHVRPQFALLRQIARTFPTHEHPGADLSGLSMGMSGDFEVAIEEGATHVRIGSALFGDRD
jgi:pyridoxal phosphate enzyme (YggS family)